MDKLLWDSSLSSSWSLIVSMWPTRPQSVQARWNGVLRFMRVTDTVRTCSRREREREQEGEGERRRESGRESE